MFILQVLTMTKSDTKSWLDEMQALANGDGGWSEGKRFAYGAFLNKFRKHLRNGQSGELAKLVKTWLNQFDGDDAKFEAIKAELVEMKVTSYGQMYTYGAAEVEYTSDEIAWAKTSVASALASGLIVNDETVIDKAVNKLCPIARWMLKTLDNGKETTTVNDKAGQDSLADALAEAGHKRVA